MPNILKRFLNTGSGASDYQFPSVEELNVGEKRKDKPSREPDEDTELPIDNAEPEEEKLSPEEEKLRFADIQARAILDDAQREAEELKARALTDAEEELEEIRRAAREEAYSRGFAEGMSEGSHQARMKLEEESEAQAAAIQEFLEEAAREKARILDDCREELKDLAVAIAEKVIRISLRSSSDILLRMVDSATDTHKRCEWAHIYIADRDVKGKAKTIPELTAALSRLSDRVKVIPMVDDESGTCIVELPDVILDASVSTQLGNIREVLAGTALDRDDEPTTFSLKKE